MTTGKESGMNAPQAKAAAVLVAIAIAAAVVFAVVGSGGGAKISAAAFQDDMRKLWEDHVTWTRLVIVSVLADLPDTGPTLDRLLRNQADIGDAIRPFYGDAAGVTLTLLLEEHITIAGEILVAAKAGDGAAADAAIARWYANANAIADFLSGANPAHWPVGAMRSMMTTHLDTTLEEAVAQLTGDYVGSIAAYDRVHAQILEMADMLTMGIVHQFPDRFTDLGAIHG